MTLRSVKVPIKSSWWVIRSDLPASSGTEQNFVSLFLVYRVSRIQEGIIHDKTRAHNYFAYSVATFFFGFVLSLFVGCNCNRRQHCLVTHGLVLCMCITELKGDGAAILS